MRIFHVYSRWRRAFNLGAVAAAATTLAACGGGTGTAGPLVSLQGVAATGLAVSGGTVDARCVGGTGATTTGVDGSFSLQSTGSAPCMLKVTTADGSELHAVADAAASRNNVNPMTEAVAALALAQMPAEAFAGFGEAKARRITAASLASAVDELKQSLEALRLDATDAEQVLHAPMVARRDGANGDLIVAGDALDQKLDDFEAALAAQGSNWKQHTLSLLDSKRPTALAAPTKAALAVPPASEWQTAVQGLPVDTLVRQMAAVDNTVYAAVDSKKSGRSIYRLDTANLNAGWQLHTRVNNLIAIVAVGNDLFVGPGSNGDAYWLSNEADGFGGRKMYALPRPTLSSGRLASLHPGQGRLLGYSGGERNGATSVLHYDISQLKNASPAALAAAQMPPVGQPNKTVVPIGAWVNTNLGIVRDNKGQISLFEDNSKNLWYTTGYADKGTGGTWRFDGKAWTKVFGALSATNTGPNAGQPGSGNHPGRFSMTRDGTIIVSVEKMPTTQVSTFYRYDPASTHPGKVEGALVPIATSPGYGIGSVPLDGDKNVFIDPRFGQFILGGSGPNAGLKKWMLPNITRGFVGDLVKPIDVRIPAYVATANGTVVAHMRTDAPNSPWQIVTYKPDVAKAPFYTAAVDLDMGTVGPAVLSDKEGVREKMAVRWIDANRLATTFNIGGALAVGEVCKPLFGKPACAEGALTVVNAAGQVLKAYRFDSPVLDMKLRTVAGKPVAVLALADGFALFDFDSETASVIARSGALRVDISAAGVIATLSRATSGYEYAVYRGLAEFGQKAAAYTRNVQRSYVEDIVISEAANRLVIVGFDNKRMPTGMPIQVAFAQGVNLATGAPSWMKFGYDGKDTTGNVADTRLYRARIGDDGDLYLSGESAGSETVFRYNGDALNGTVILKYTDFYNQLWNTASAHMSYHAQLDPQTGVIKQAQLTMGRLSSGKSNTFRVRDIAVAQGRVFMPAVGAASIGNRDANVINGGAVSSYAGGDPVMLAVDSGNFANRLAWTPLVKGAGAQGDMRSVDTRGTKVALFGYANGAGTVAAVACGTTDCTVDAQRRPYLVVLDAEKNFAVGP